MTINCSINSLGPDDEFFTVPSYPYYLYQTYISFIGWTPPVSIPLLRENVVDASVEQHLFNQVSRNMIFGVSGFCFIQKFGQSTNQNAMIGTDFSLLITPLFFSVTTTIAAVNLVDICWNEAFSTLTGSLLH